MPTDVALKFGYGTNVFSCLINSAPKYAMNNSPFDPLLVAMKSIMVRINSTKNNH